jgi:hypothetical protein
MKFFVAIFIVFVLMPISAKYGGTWDSQLHPRSGMAVALAGGETISGALSREWSGAWSLREPPGTVRTFDDRDMRWMRSVLPGDADRASTALPLRLVFPALLAFIAIALAIGWRPSVARRRSTA